MLFFEICLKVIEEEKKKCNLSEQYLISQIGQFTTAGTSFESPYSRCAFMYKCATISYEFMKHNIEQFLAIYVNNEDLFSSFKLGSNLQFCSLTSGPALDYFAFIDAFAECKDPKLNPIFTNVKVITTSAQWKNTLNFIIDAIKEECKKNTVSTLCDNFKFIQNSLLIFTEKQRNEIQDADVLFAMKMLNLSSPDASETYRKAYFKDVINAMKLDSLLFCIDTKPSIAAMADILCQIPGKYVFEPVHNSKAIEKVSDIYKEKYGSLPTISARGCFFVWKKLGIDFVTTPIHLNLDNQLVFNHGITFKGKETSCVVKDVEPSLISSPKVNVTTPLDKLFVNFSPIAPVEHKVMSNDTQLKSSIQESLKNVTTKPFSLLCNYFISSRESERNSNIYDDILINPNFECSSNGETNSEELSKVGHNVETKPGSDGNENINLNEIKEILSDICNAVCWYLDSNNINSTNLNHTQQNEISKAQAVSNEDVLMIPLKKNSEENIVLSEIVSGLNHSKEGCIDVVNHLSLKSSNNDCNDNSSTPFKTVCSSSKKRKKTRRGKKNSNIAYSMLIANSTQSPENVAQNLKAEKCYASTSSSNSFTVLTPPTFDFPNKSNNNSFHKSSAQKNNSDSHLSGKPEIKNENKHKVDNCATYINKIESSTCTEEMCERNTASMQVLIDRIRKLISVFENALVKDELQTGCNLGTSRGVLNPSAFNSTSSTNINMFSSDQSEFSTIPKVCHSEINPIPNICCKPKCTAFQRNAPEIGSNMRHINQTCASYCQVQQYKNDCCHSICRRMHSCLPHDYETNTCCMKSTPYIHGCCPNARTSFPLIQQNCKHNIQNPNGGGIDTPNIVIPLQNISEEALVQIMSILKAGALSKDH